MNQMYFPSAEPRVEAALSALRAGRMVVLSIRYGYVIQAAAHSDAVSVNFMATHARGLVCLAMDDARMRRLGLTPQPRMNAASGLPEYMVSIEAASGVSTGISAKDRARTIAAATHMNAGRNSVVSPGHVFPIRAAPGGLAERTTCAEAAIALARLAGLPPSLALCAILDSEGNMVCPDTAGAFARRMGLQRIGLADLIRAADEPAAV